MELKILFLLLLFVVAFLYSSVGHGGASGYLALMALFSIDTSVMRSTALLLNIFVSLIAFIQYYRSGYFKWKLFWPFALVSIPFAFIGAGINLDTILYKKILGVVLLFPVLRLFGIFDIENIENKELNFSFALFIGAVIGLLSGVLGIGGGILLSPIILLLHWGNMKQTASVSALFIFVNSVAGFSSILLKGIHFQAEIYYWIVISLAGGILGSYFGSKKLSNTILKRILALVLCLASFKLIFI